MSSSALVGDSVRGADWEEDGGDLSAPIWRAEGRKEEMEESIGIGWDGGDV